MILSLDPDIYHSPTQKISLEPFPVFSCFFNSFLYVISIPIAPSGAVIRIARTATDYTI